MGISQLVFALVSATHQTAPGGVQLGALLLDVVYRFGVGLDQTLRRFPQRVYLDNVGEATSNQSSQSRLDY